MRTDYSWAQKLLPSAIRCQWTYECQWAYEKEGIMSLVRLLGFTTLACGCVVGKYREVATNREVSYVEEKGKSCGSHGHRRNHTIATERLASVSLMTLATKAS